MKDNCSALQLSMLTSMPHSLSAEMEHLVSLGDVILTFALEPEETDHQKLRKFHTLEKEIITGLSSAINCRLMQYSCLMLVESGFKAKL